jgi:hypothetical protein
MNKKEREYMTAKEFAEKIGRPYPTVYLWLRTNQIPEAVYVEFGNMKVWQIPHSVLETFKPPKVGRPSKQSISESLTAGESTTERRPSKPAKKSKRSGGKGKKNQGGSTK